MRRNIKTLLTFNVVEKTDLLSFLMDKMHGISRNRVKALLTNRVVLVDNKITTHPLTELRPGQIPL